MKIISMGAVVVLGVSLAGVAGADESGFTPRFGIAADFTADLQVSTLDIDGEDQTTTEVSLAPSVDYFVTPQITVGGGILLSYEDTEDVETTTTLGLATQAGYFLSISDQLAFWPQVGLGLARAATEREDGFGTSEFTLTTAAVSLSAPVLLRLTPSFYIGAGPQLVTSFWSSVDFDGEDLDVDFSQTSYGLLARVGGFF